MHRTQRTPHELSRKRAWLAPLRVCIGLGVMSQLGAFGCLVTDKFEYDVRNVRSHIEVVLPPTFTRVSQTDDPECAATGGMLFLAVVSDPDDDDELEARVLINGSDVNTLSRSISTPGKSNEELEVPLCVKETHLPKECNRLELLVSRGFRVGVDRYDTRFEDDLAKVEWWILGPSGNTPGARPSDCAALFGDAGVP